MDLHGGSISVESCGEGQGSTFTVTLPLIEVDCNEIEDGSLRSPDSRISISAEECIANKPSSESRSDKSQQEQQSVVRSILVVDDSAINRKMMCRLFTRNSIPCDQAEDGFIAVEMVQAISNEASTETDNWLLATVDVGGIGSDSIIVGRGQYDVILMDYQMPNMDGPTAIRAIRSLGYKGVIFGVTGNVMALDQQEMMAAGADDVLPKPFDIDKFWDAYKRVRRLSEASFV